MTVNEHVSGVWGVGECGEPNLEPRTFHRHKRAAVNRTRTCRRTHTRTPKQGHLYDRSILASTLTLTPFPADAGKREKRESGKGTAATVVLCRQNSLPQFWDLPPAPHLPAGIFPHPGRHVSHAH